MEQRSTTKGNQEKKIIILSFESLFVTNKSFNLYLVAVLKRMAKEGKLETWMEGKLKKLEEKDITEKNAHTIFNNEIIDVKAYIREHDGFKKDTDFIQSILNSTSPLSFGVGFHWNTVFEQIIEYNKNDCIVIASEFPEALITAYLKKLGISEGILSKIKILPNSIATIQESFPPGETSASIVHFNEHFFEIYPANSSSNNLKISMPKVKSLDYNDISGLYFVLTHCGSFDQQALDKPRIEYLEKQFNENSWCLEINKGAESFKEVFFIFSVIMKPGIPAQNIAPQMLPWLMERFSSYVSFLAESKPNLSKLRDGSYFSKNDLEKATQMKNYLAREAASKKLKNIFSHFSLSHYSSAVNQLVDSQKRSGNEFSDAEKNLRELSQKITGFNPSDDHKSIDQIFVLIFTEIWTCWGLLADREDANIKKLKEILLQTLKKMQEKINDKLAFLCKSEITAEDYKFIVYVFRLKNMGHPVALTEEQLESLSLKAVRAHSLWASLKEKLEKIRSIYDPIENAAKGDLSYLAKEIVEKFLCEANNLKDPNFCTPENINFYLKVSNEILNICEKITQIKKCFTEKEGMLKSHMIKSQEHFKFLLQNDLLRSVRETTGVEDFKNYADQVYKIIEKAIKEFLDNGKDFKKFVDALDFAKINNEINLKAEAATKKITLLMDFIDQEKLIDAQDTASAKDRVSKKLEELKNYGVKLSDVKLEEEKNEPFTDQTFQTRGKSVLLAVSGIFSGWKKEDGKRGNAQENKKIEKKI